MRGGLCRFLALCLLIGPLGEAWAALSAEDVTVDHRAGSYFVAFRVAVAVPAAVALEVLTDFERMPAFLPNLSQSRILERQGNVFVIHQQGRAVFGPFSFPFTSQRRIELRPDGRLLAQSLPGSSQTLRSELHYREQAGVTWIDYHLEAKPESWWPTALGVGFLRHEIAEQFSAMCAEMERRELAKKNGPPERRANLH